jgi:hypothetical protein
MTTDPLTLSLLPDRLAICRLDPHAETPDWATGPDRFVSWTRTREELSIVCPEDRVPEGVRSDRGWRALKLEGPLELTMTGIIASMAAPLAEAGIPIFAIATFETDYLLVRDSQLDSSIAALRERGHTVNAGD